MVLVKKKKRVLYIIRIEDINMSTYSYRWFIKINIVENIVFLKIDVGKLYVYMINEIWYIFVSLYKIRFIWNKDFNF